MITKRLSSFISWKKKWFWKCFPWYCFSVPL